jgi:two-component system response regulator FixJ
MTPGHVFIVDDDDGLRLSIGDLLLFAGYRVRCWADPFEFLVQMPTAAPAVLLTDMCMPGISGVDLHAELLRRGRTLPVVYLSGQSSLPQGLQAMKQGAFDFILKPFGREHLLRVVAAAIERDRQAMWSVMTRARIDAALASLSPREREVHALLLQGCGNAEIVKALGVALPTAKQYKSEVMRKLGVRSLSELMVHAGASTTPDSGPAQRSQAT